MWSESTDLCEIAYDFRAGCVSRIREPEGKFYHLPWTELSVAPKPHTFRRRRIKRSTL